MTHPHLLRRILLVGSVLFSGAVLGNPPDHSQGQVSEGAEPMPEILYFREHGDDPFFVSPERLLLPSGEIDPDLYQPGYAAGIEAILELPDEDGCVHINVPSDYRHAPRPEWRDLASLIDTAEFVIVARVTGLAPGFRFDEAGTLVRFIAEEWLKGDDLWGAQDDRYVFFPIGEFTIGSRSICKTQGQWPQLPTLESRLVLLLEDNWFNRRSKMVAVRAPQVLVLPPGRPAQLSSVEVLLSP